MRNMQHDDNDTLARFGITNFTDLSQSEFSEQLLNGRVDYKLKSGLLRKTFNPAKFRSFYTHDAPINSGNSSLRVDW